MAQLNSVGKALVAQHRKKFFFRLKIYVASLIVGGLIGLSIGGFWPSLINRCPACGRLSAKKAHRRTIGPNGPIYYNCQPEQRASFFVPPPRQNTLNPPTDDR